MERPAVILVYDHYLPDYTAGGPVTSIRHITQLCGSDFDMHIITSNRIYQTGARLPVVTDSWIPSDKAMIWYASDPSQVGKAIRSMVHRHPLVWFNGIFSLNYFLRPLRVVVQSKLSYIVSPRGMLQAGALKGGRLKKLIYLTCLRQLGWLKNARWHATDEQEKHDIQKIFGRVHCLVLPNIPAIPGQEHCEIVKASGTLRLVYYSLIASKKNLLFLLNLLQNPKLKGVHLEIIGPVKDFGYWESCKAIIKRLPESTVDVIGSVTPELGQEAICRNEFFVLPTKGENFGHAIVEALAAGRPVLISNNTPWSDVTEKGAGRSLPLEAEIWVTTMRELMDWSHEQFLQACRDARNYYAEKFNFEQLKKQYIALLNTALHDHPRT